MEMKLWQDALAQRYKIYAHSCVTLLDHALDAS
jgi:hypothetical protein